MEMTNSSTPKFKLPKGFTRNKKYLKGATLFKNIAVLEYKGKLYFEAHIQRYRYYEYFENERQAAIAVDKKLLEMGEEPVNILVRLKKQDHETQNYNNPRIANGIS
jgi:hypothetical protein